MHLSCKGFHSGEAVGAADLRGSLPIWDFFRKENVPAACFQAKDEHNEDCYEVTEPRQDAKKLRERCVLRALYQRRRRDLNPRVLFGHLLP